MLKTRLLLIIFGIFLFYLLGLFVRRAYGVRLVVKNDSGELLHQVGLKFTGRDYHYELAVPDLAQGKRMRLFVKPGRKSLVTLEFTDSHNLRHRETAEDYVFADNCGSMTFAVQAFGKVDATIPAQPLIAICWDSWLGFIY
jgi:hypothetical protein